MDSILAYDLTGGGVMAALAPTSFTIKGPSSQNAYIVGYASNGISPQGAVVTCANDERWEAAGFNLHNTADGTAVGAGDQWVPLPVKVPVRGGDVLAITSVSGANPHWVILYIDYPPFNYKARDPFQSQPSGCLITRTTAASGVNLTAGVVQGGLVTLVGFGARTYSPVYIHMTGGTMTTDNYMGIKKLGDPYTTFWRVPLIAAGDDQKVWPLPQGMFTVGQGDTVEISWAGDTANQPIAMVTFAYPV